MVKLYKWQAVIVDEAGEPCKNASVQICHELSAPNFPLADIYADRDGQHSINNPTTADEKGFVYCYVLKGAYRVTATFDGKKRVWRVFTIGNGE